MGHKMIQDVDIAPLRIPVNLMVNIIDNGKIRL